MHNKFVSTITTGALIGVVVGAMLMPNMDRSTKRRVKNQARW